VPAAEVIAELEQALAAARRHYTALRTRFATVVERLDRRPDQE
jgi:uncharacterized coiled-coil protein SlyX